MRKQNGLYLALVAFLLLFFPGVCGAWLVGDFEIPVKKIQSKSEVLYRPDQTWRESVTGMEFVWVPKGCFQMGSNIGDADEKPVHKVCVNGFWIGKYEVTQGQWQKIMGNNPSYFKKGENYPVEKVSWDECQEFISILINKGGNDFRLPTEAEWEYACRSVGQDEKYSGGNDVNQVAWYDGNSGSSTHAVGSKEANGLGIYDMSGNVWEWCSDCYNHKKSAFFSPTKNYYENSPVQNPQGVSSSSNRVNRGGSWRDGPWRVRSTYRNGNMLGYFYDDLGFRLVVSGRQKSK